MRAILEDAGYRVIDSGIEKVLRELSCLSSLEYNALGYPDAMSYLPDFTVMDRGQKEKILVEVKYRSKWDKKIFDEVQEQVRIFGEMVLVSVNATATNPRELDSPGRFLRCCRLKFDGEIYKVEIRKGSKDFKWKDVDSVHNGPALWWSMTPLQEKFDKLSTETDGKTLSAAISAIAGIVTQ